VTDDEAEMLRELRDAFLRTEPGHKEPLLTRLAVMEAEWRRMKWGSRLLLVTFVSIGSLVAAWDKIKHFVAGLVK